MNITAQVSLYPLRQAHVGPSVETFLTALREAGLQPEVGVMSTVLRGDSAKLFPALHEAFDRTALQGDTVLVVTLSNACEAEPV
jgi:uncharacterized protein YqgV (UPF0045/DUF77 family)